MPQPNARDLHIDAYLTNVLVGYKNPAYIASQIFPRVPVQKQSDIIPAVNQSSFFRDEAQLRAIGTKSQGSGWTNDNTNKYFCDRYSFRREIPDDLRDNTDQPFNLDVISSESALDKILMRRERDFTTSFMVTSKWGTDVTGGSTVPVWSDYAASTPFVDLTTYDDTIEGSVGQTANTLVLGKQVWSKLKWHPDLVDTIKYTERGIPGPDLLAAAAEIDKVLIGKAIYTTSPEGTAEASVVYTRIWGKNALLAYVPDAPSLMTPAAGYTFVWERVANADAYIKRMRDEEREVDIVEANGYFDQKLVVKNAGVFFSGIVA